MKSSRRMVQASEQAVAGTTCGILDKFDCISEWIWNATSEPFDHQIYPIEPKRGRIVVSADLNRLLQPKALLSIVLNFALVLSTAFMLWKGLSVFTNSSSPIVVVLSGSMEPAFQRGDLLFLWNRGMETQVGEIVVYNVRGKDIPIVHRVVRRFGGGYVWWLQHV